MDPMLRGDLAPVVIAHRGASCVAPENTMPAFEEAWNAGASWVEADVQPTADNVPVLLHDADVDRTTNGRGPVRTLTSSAVGALDAGSWFPTGSARAHRDTRVPMLADLVNTLDHDRSLLLEIKGDHNRDHVQAALAVVQASPWDERVLLQSFEREALRHVRSIDPGRAVGILAGALDDDPVSVCIDLGAVAYSPRHHLLRERPGLVAELHGAGIAIFGWTADDPADWEFLTDLGIDGIITNDPARLLAWQRIPRSALTPVEQTSPIFAEVDASS